MDEQLIPSGSDISPMESAFNKLATSEDWQYIIKYQEEREKIIMQSFRSISLVDGGLKASQYQGILIGLYDIIEAVNMAKSKVDEIIKKSNEVNKNK